LSLLNTASAVAIGATLLSASTMTLIAQPANASSTGATMVADAPGATLATNPLIGDWITPDGTPPYDRIKPEHYVPAFEEAMRHARQDLTMIGAQRSSPTFENTLERMERSGPLLRRTSAAFFTVASSHATPEIEAIQGEMSPRLAAFQSETYLDKALFARIDTLQRNRGRLNLSAEQARLLDVTHRSFVRSGAALPDAQRNRLVAIDKELAGLNFEFGKKVLADQKAGDTVLGADAMAGTPQAFRDGAAAKAQAAGKPGLFVVSATRSDFEAFMTLATDRAAREMVFEAFDNRGDNGNANDTGETIAKMVALRLERAKLLGYKSHADFQLVTSMAETPEAAQALLVQVYEAALVRAREEERDVMALAKADGIGTLEPWDWRFYSEKVRSARYALDETHLKQYLPLDGMLKALWETSERLFGIKVTERRDISTWHPETRTFDVFDADGKRLGLFYGDWFARDTKQPGAWMNEIRGQNGLEGLAAQVVNNSNFTPPAEGQAALISFDDAETLFHEFGHALHGLMSDTRYPGLAGTRVYRDFVEFPSQVYEHWVGERDILAKHARNAKGEAMPPALLDALLKARTFNQGYQTVQQLASALVDMDLHRLEALPADFDAGTFEAETLKKYGVPHAIGMRHRLPHFGHIFSGGYSAGYYAYTWAEVLEADAFDMWQEAGDVWSRDVAASFRRNILAVGNSRPPQESYVAFRGRMPTPDALLRNRGLK